MSSTVFIAVQCCQCSTMQAKQKKKSSNKWTCVVCNQKQSVLKVFAQSYMAKDIRQFVQSSNMSRKNADEQASLVQHEAVWEQLKVPVSRKRRVDWSEYLDPAEHELEETSENGDEGDIQVITEIPKRASVRNGAFRQSHGDCVEYNDRLQNHVSLKNNFRNQLVNSSQGGSKKLEPKKLVDTKTLNDTHLICNKETQTCLVSAATKASKWDEYVNEDDDQW